MSPIHTTPNRYRLSFTFGGLLIPETRVVAKALQRHQDWNAARDALLKENTLGKTRASSVKRYVREIRARLTAAYDWELDLLPSPDAPVILFAVITRYYQLIGDVTTQLLRQRLQNGLNRLDVSLIRAFMGDQIPVHPELDEITSSTREKLITVMMRIFREAGITRVAAGGNAVSAQTLSIQPPALSPGLRDRYCTQGITEDLAHLLWTDKEIARCIR
jgi:hypothetical protein